MLKKIALFFTTMFAINTFAALSPFYQSIAEYKRLLNHPQLVQKIGNSRSIYSIARKGDVFKIKANECRLKAKITYTPRNDGSVGPAIFFITFGNIEKSTNHIWIFFFLNICCPILASKCKSITFQDNRLYIFAIFTPSFHLL